MKTVSLASPRARDLIVEVVENSPAVMPEIAARQRIRDALAEATGDAMLMEDADYAELRRLVEKYLFKGPFDDALALGAALASAAKPAEPKKKAAG